MSSQSQQLKRRSRSYHSGPQCLSNALLSRARPPDGGEGIRLAAVALYGLRRGFDAIRHRPHLRRMTHLELNYMQTEVLIRELSSIVQNDRYPLSPRIRVLKEILGMMRPEPARPAPLPPLRN